MLDILSPQPKQHVWLSQSIKTMGLVTMILNKDPVKAWDEHAISVGGPDTSSSESSSVRHVIYWLGAPFRPILYLTNKGYDIPQHDLSTR